MNDDIKWLVVANWCTEKYVLGRFSKYDDALKFKRIKVRHYRCNWDDFSIIEAD